MTQRRILRACRSAEEQLPLLSCAMMEALRRVVNVGGKCPVFGLGMPKQRGLTTRGRKSAGSSRRDISETRIRLGRGGRRVACGGPEAAGEALRGRGGCAERSQCAEPL